MLDIKQIREQTKQVKENLTRRKDPELLKKLDQVVKKDEKYRQTLYQVEKLRHEKNDKSQEINQLKKEKKDIKKTILEVRKVTQTLAEKEQELIKLKQELTQQLMRLPNIMHESVPYGKDDTENKEIRKWGKPKKFDFEIKNHGELAEQLGIADFERSAKISGKGFYFMLGDLTMLNQALIRYGLEKLMKKGFTPVEPPEMMRRKPYEGVTDLADFENMIYKSEGEDQYFIATSEHPIAAMLMDESISEEKLPLKFAGLSINFRKEIGSHGVDEKGFFRMHQFWKVEQLIFCKPEDSWKIHEEIIKNAEEIYQELDLPYHVVNICTGDLGIVAAKKYDLEVWMPRTKEYKEVVSCSNCTDYQARRLNIKCRDKYGNNRTLHTLNSTAIATSRTLVAILENYQNKDGSITIPTVLQKYMNGKKKITTQKII
ncbi:MAG: serine--tRNA ligase [Nanoarchaeota archaeon]|nr:serine--tRNA ligase [Nanoarchaeota archaeon]MBU1854816.1 serine--tRNA ligase [Nanoarchaeota archaeon]